MGDQPVLTPLTSLAKMVKASENTSKPGVHKESNPIHIEMSSAKTKAREAKESSKTGMQRECAKHTELTIAKTKAREAQRVTFQPELEVIVENPKSSHPVIITKVKLKVMYFFCSLPILCLLTTRSCVFMIYVH